jgi:hypothetical protein
MNCKAFLDTACSKKTTQALIRNARVASEKCKIDENQISFSGHFDRANNTMETSSA